MCWPSCSRSLLPALAASAPAAIGWRLRPPCRPTWRTFAARVPGRRRSLPPLWRPRHTGSQCWRSAGTLGRRLRRALPRACGCRRRRLLAPPLTTSRWCSSAPRRTTPGAGPGRTSLGASATSWRRRPPCQTPSTTPAPHSSPRLPPPSPPPPLQPPSLPPLQPPLPLPRPPLPLTQRPPPPLRRCSPAPTPPLLPPSAPPMLLLALAALLLPSPPLPPLLLPPGPPQPPAPPPLLRLPPLALLPPPPPSKLHRLLGSLLGRGRRAAVGRTARTPAARGPSARFSSARLPSGFRRRRHGAATTSTSPSCPSMVTACTPARARRARRSRHRSSRRRRTCRPSPTPRRLALWAALTVIPHARPLLPPPLQPAPQLPLPRPPYPGLPLPHPSRRGGPPPPSRPRPPPHPSHRPLPCLPAPAEAAPARPLLAPVSGWLTARRLTPPLRRRAWAARRPLLLTTPP